MFQLSRKHHKANRNNNKDQNPYFFNRVQDCFAFTLTPRNSEGNLGSFYIFTFLFN